MTELKTLKEITRFSREGHGEEKKWWLKCVNVDELRQEAIKWVKEINETNGDVLPIDYVSLNSVHSVVQFIKHFFNITEDELR